MKKLISIIVSLIAILSHVAHAQENATNLSGQVVNSEGEAIPYANVMAFSLPDSVLISGCVTDSKGRFEFASLPNPMYLVIKCIGYESKTISSIPLLSPIILNDNSVELSEIVVLASFTTRKRTGEISVRMQGNPIGKGKGIVEALRYIQGVEVFGDEILVNGKGSTLIFLGDRQISQQELKTIPTSMIKNIEVIPNAGASYGHKAKGGAIRVFLRDIEGIIGSVELRGQADKNGFVDALLSPVLHYQRGKFSFYNNISVGFGKYHKHFEILDKYSNHNVARETFLDIKSKAIVDNFSMSYQPNKQHSIQFYGGVNFTNNGNDSKAYTNEAPSLIQNNNQYFREISSGLNYIFRFRNNPSSLFSTKVEYLNQKNKNNLQYILGSEDESKLLQQLSFLQVQPRLELKLKGGSNLNAGIVFDYLNDDNQMNGISNPLLSNIKERSFVISGGDFAPWIEYSQLIGKKMYMQLGLRYQATQMRYSDRLLSVADYQVRHKGLYPELQLQYMLNPERQSGIGFSYKRDFSLPNYGYYNPIATYQHEKQYSIGNQELKPELFHVFEINYYFNPQWVFTYSLRSGANMVHLMSYQDHSHPELFYTRPENVGRLFQHYASIAYTSSNSKFWQSNNRLFVRNRKETMPERRVNSTSLGWRFTHQFQVKDNIGLTLAFNGETAQKSLSYETNLRYGVDFGAYVSLLKNNLSINLSCLNILRSKDKIRIVTDFIDTTRTNLSPLSRLKATITWNFSTGDKIRRKNTNVVSAPSRETPSF